MMLPAVLPINSTPPIMHQSPPLPPLPSSPPLSPPTSSSEDDNDMHDTSPPLGNQISSTTTTTSSTTTSTVTTTPTQRAPTTPSKRLANTKDPEEDLAESVMNWDLGGNENTRGTKRKTTVQEPEPEVKELVVKLQKLTHDVHKVDGVRIIHVKFAPGVILKAKKLFQGIYTLPARKK